VAQLTPPSQSRAPRQPPALILAPSKTPAARFDAEGKSFLYGSAEQYSGQ
jgi:hypothetical protein